MASSIDASTSGAGGVITTADNTGILQLKTAGVVAVTVNASSALGVGTSPSYGTSGQVLTSSGSSAAPTWSTISSGGMTLLGTLTTTSGTTQTLSGLTLTNYKFLQFSINNVGYSSADVNQSLRLAGVNITRPVMTNISSAQCANLFLDLSNGAFSGGSYIDNYTTNYSDYAFVVAGNISSITTSTTSLSFTWTSGQAFTRGTIKVYGVA